MVEKITERRKTRRFRTRFMARYRVEGQKELKVAPIDNISTNGILLEEIKSSKPVCEIF